MKTLETVNTHANIAPVMTSTLHINLNLDSWLQFTLVIIIVFCFTNYLDNKQESASTSSLFYLYNWKDQVNWLPTDLFMRENLGKN